MDTLEIPIEVSIAAQAAASGGGVEAIWLVVALIGVVMLLGMIAFMFLYINTSIHRSGQEIERREAMVDRINSVEKREEDRVRGVEYRQFAPRTP